MSGTAACAPEGERHFWDRTVLVWHLVFGVSIGAAAVTRLVDDGTRTEKAWILGLLALTAGWYAVTGGRALHGEHRPYLGHLYLVGLVPIFGAIVAVDPGIDFLLFTAIPQIFLFIDRLLYAAFAVSALFVTFGIVLYVHRPEVREDVGSLVLQLGVSLLISVVFGGWIGGIIRQSQQRAALIGELRETRAALAAERHAAGIAAERERLAHEIHDTLAQGFTSVLMLTQAADAVLDADPVAVRRQLRLIEATARENLSEARQLVAALAPAGLDGATLAQAVRRLADRHQADTAVPVDVAVDGTPAADPDRDVVLLRVAQEALANVRKHAEAASALVALRYGAEATTLTVTDTGRGFDPGAPTSGFGLRGMRSRVEQSGGTMRVRSDPAAGTTVEVVLP